MVESISKCPACAEPLRTAAEMAAHRCARVGTDEEIAAASLEQSLAAARRQAIKPTPAKLEQDCRFIAQQLHECWDGEVEFVVILSPRETPGRVHWSTNVGKRDRLKILLERTKSDSVKMSVRPLVEAGA